MALIGGALVATCSISFGGVLNAACSTSFGDINGFDSSGV